MRWPLAVLILLSGIHCRAYVYKPDVDGTTNLRFHHIAAEIFTALHLGNLPVYHSANDTTLLNSYETDSLLHPRMFFVGPEKWRQTLTESQVWSYEIHLRKEKNFTLSPRLYTWHSNDVVPLFSIKSEDIKKILDTKSYQYLENLFINNTTKLNYYREIHIEKNHELLNSFYDAHLRIYHLAYEKKIKAYEDPLLLTELSREKLSLLSEIQDFIYDSAGIEKTTIDYQPFYFEKVKTYKILFEINVINGTRSSGSIYSFAPRTLVFDPPLPYWIDFEELKNKDVLLGAIADSFIQNASSPYAWPQYTFIFKENRNGIDVRDGRDCNPTDSTRLGLSSDLKNIGKNQVGIGLRFWMLDSFNFAYSIYSLVTYDTLSKQTCFTPFSKNLFQSEKQQNKFIRNFLKVKMLKNVVFSVQTDSESGRAVYKANKLTGVKINNLSAANPKGVFDITFIKIPFDESIYVLSLKPVK